MSSAIIDRDRGFRALVKRFVRFGSGPNVRVGVQGHANNEPREFGMSNVKLAAVHEFGSKDGRVPQRSFIRATIDRERKKLSKLLAIAARRAALDGNIKRELGIVGEKAVAEMVRTIDQSIGLKPLTLAGILGKQVPSTTPLIDTGQLKRSISWEYRRR